jgi:hypothetical protein
VVARDGHGASSDSSGHSVLMSNKATAQSFAIVEAVLAGTEVAELARTLEISIEVVRAHGTSSIIWRCSILFRRPIRNSRFRRSGGFLSP